MTDFKIQKGIAIPPIMAASGRAPKYPFGKMSVSDSFFFFAALKSKVAFAAYSYGHRNSMKFMVRAEGGGVRVWRVK